MLRAYFSFASLYHSFLWTRPHFLWFFHFKEDTTLHGLLLRLSVLVLC